MGSPERKSKMNQKDHPLTPHFHNNFNFKELLVPLSSDRFLILMRLSARVAWLAFVDSRMRVSQPRGIAGETS